MGSLAATLALIEPHYPRVLVSRSAEDELRRVAGTLPAALSRCVYLECRPGRPDEVDLVVDVESAGREILTGDNPQIHLDVSLSSHGAWPRVQSFARAWSAPSGSLAALIAGAWLEFDLAAREQVPNPSVFVDFSDTLVHDDSVERRDNAIALAAGALGVSLDAATRGNVRRCVAALPTHGMLLYAGYMLARENGAVRLCVMGLGGNELARYLGDIGWRGNVAAVAELTAFFAGETTGGQRQAAIVHIDVGATVGLGLGLEYPFARRPQLSGTLVESAFLDALSERGLLTGEQRSAMAAWPGYERLTMPHELWPSVLVRRVNHVKIVMPDGHTPAVKVYLCAEHVPEHQGGVAAAGGE